MKHLQVKVGGVYIAKVNGKLVPCRLDAIKENGSGYKYYVTNTITSRKTVFGSAAKFRYESNEDWKIVGVASTKVPKEVLPKPDHTCALGTDKTSTTATAKTSSSEVTTQTVLAIPSPMDSPVVTTLAAQLKQAMVTRTPPSNAPHIIVQARAGTGKTTTGEEGLKLMRGMETRFKGSPQQQAIWEAMKESKDAEKICFTAFGKDIAEEVKRRLSESGLDRKGIEGMTTHSMGFRAVRNSFTLRPGKDSCSQFVVLDYIAEALGANLWQLKKDKPTLLNATNELVGLCKQTLSESDPASLAKLTSHYDVELNGSGNEVFGLVPKILERCKDPSKRGQIDFNDMVWLPLVLNLPLTKYDFGIIDESQDLNRARQELVKRAFHRLMLVGDEKQAIFGFAGADAESMKRMQADLGTQLIESHKFPGDDSIYPGETLGKGVKLLPLTVTRRCGKAIVEEARRIVPDFEAHESNCNGEVSEAKYTSYKNSYGQLVTRPESETYLPLVGNEDMILCRCNAPLVSQCFKFLGIGRNASILGKDEIGQRLLRLIAKLCGKENPQQVPTRILQLNLQGWNEEETAKEMSQKNPSESRLASIADRVACLYCFMEGTDTAANVIAKIDAIFTNNQHSPGIRLSSVHKAKGLESKTVFLLQPEGAAMPHPKATSEWQYEQEMNLLYVAITRAIEELIYVY